MTIFPPIPDSQAEVSLDEDEALTDTEVEFLDLYESMSEEDQAVLTRIAQFLEASPQDEPTSREKLEELFFSAKRLQ